MTTLLAADSRIGVERRALLPQFLSRHAFVAPAIFISLCVCFWFATWGEGDLFYPEHLCGFYDAQARSLLAGRLDVPPEAIEFEAFIHDGKTYGYFGIAPALLRVPLVLLFAKMDGRWSRLLMLAGVGVGLVCAYRIVLAAGAGQTLAGRKPLIFLFLLMAGIGATPVFIVSRCYVYHEAILWGAVFSLLFADRLLAYLARPRASTLLTAAVFAFMAFHSRATGGAGAVGAMGLLGVMLAIRMRRRSTDPADFSPSMPGPVDRPGLHLLVVAFSLIVIIGVYLAVNYGRFGTFDGVPVRYYRMYMTNPVRMKITGGRQFHVENFASSFASYFGGRGISFRSEFPWVYMVDRAQVIGSPALDVVEPYASVPWAMPGLFLLALAGAWPVLAGSWPAAARLRLPALALLIGGGVVLFTVGITQRYLHDFYPAIVLLSAAGLVRLMRSGAGRSMDSGARAGAPAGAMEVASRRRHFPRAVGQPIKVAALGALALVSIANNCAFALVFQREVVWGVPESKQRELAMMRARVGGWLHQSPPLKGE